MQNLTHRNEAVGGPHGPVIEGIRWAKSKPTLSRGEEELGKAEDQSEDLKELQNFFSGTPPPLEESNK